MSLTDEVVRRLRLPSVSRLRLARLSRPHLPGVPRSRLPSVAGLRAKLIVPYVALALVIAMVGVFVVTRLVASSIRERFVNQAFEASRVSADGIVRRERAHLEVLRLMAFTEGVPELFARRDGNGLSGLLWPLVVNSSVQSLTAVDPQGRELLSLDLDLETGEYIASQGRDFSQFGLVDKVLDGHIDGIGDKFVELLDTDFGPTMFTSAPVRDADGQGVGVLMLGTRMETMLAELKAQALADVVVLGADGRVVATTLVEPEEGYGTLEVTLSQMAEPDASAIREFSLYGRPFQAAYGPLVVRQQTVGVLGVVLPSNYIVSTEATSRNAFSLLFALGTVGIFAVGFVLAESIARPILRLRSISQAVAAGDLDHSTDLSRSDEIGELATAFDTMTLRLRERTAEAARLYAETEQRNQELVDINARLQSTQAQLIQSEKLGAIGQLTAGLVHDVRNPLAVIKGLAEELSEEKRLKKSVKELLGAIQDSATKANAIVTDLLTFARQSTPEMQSRDMRETIQSSLRLTAYLTRKAKIDVVDDLPSEPVMMTYDAHHIEQVLINLITNAVQAMSGGGTLRISLGQADEAVAIAIQDTGVGIPAENLPRIFDPFFTTASEGEGTGLGLSVSYGIV
ncbi:MAG: ATP-binding protein, partial [Anaerolineae bacterium]